MTEQQEATLRAEFNRWAQEGRGGDMERRRPLMEKVIGLMQVQPKDRLLDVGCGSGWATRWLARLAPEGLAVGLDISDEMVRQARRLSWEVENVIFVIGAADEIPWQEDFFSAVLSVESAQYWPDPERAAREIFRATAPGGRVFVLMNLYRENPLADRWQQIAPVPVILKSASEWGHVFAAAGFEAVETHQIPDETPFDADFQPSPWYRSREEETEVRRIGPLLVQALKPVRVDKTERTAGADPRLIVLD